MKNCNVFAVVLFSIFAQNNLCLAAPPECKEPGAPKGCFEKNAVSAPVHTSVGIPAWATADPAMPIRPDIAQIVNTSPFFKLPKGDYVPFETHTVTNHVNKTTSDITRVITRVAGSPLCRSTNKIVSGDHHSEMESLSWGGWFFLSSRTESANRYAPSVDTSQVTRLDKLQGQPFPLKAGNTFGLEMASELKTTLLKTSEYEEEVKPIRRGEQKMSCQVGESGPASTIRADLKGVATAITCTTIFEGNTTTRPLYWLDSVGCFVTIPKP